MFQLSKIFLAVIAFAALPLTISAQISETDLQIQVDQARQDHNLVGLGVAVITKDMNEPIIAVTGERRRGSGDMIEPGDAWHIGSNTKMLTALTYAKLVERGDAKWGATLPDLFPDLAATLHTDWQDVTIEDLLSHRSGLEPNIGRMAMVARIFDERPLYEQRNELVQNTLKKPAYGLKGEFAYSNLGYILAGAVITPIVTQDLDLIKPFEFEWAFNHVFSNDLEDLGGTVGFGPPKAGIEGHRKPLFGRKLTAVGDSKEADNPAIFGPAGTMHINLRTHAIFLAKHFIKGDTAIKNKLLSPYPNADSDYALGWGVVDMEGIGKVFGHSGSNTMWLSNVTYAPSLDAIVIVNTNQFNDDARNAVRAITADLLNQIADSK